MSRMKPTAVDKLLAKRAAIDAKIEAVKIAELRGMEILAMSEFTAILHLDDTILRAEFSRIGTENRTM